GYVTAIGPPEAPPAARPGLAPSPALFLELPGGQLLNRFLEALPALLTWFLVTAPFWAGMVAPIQFAVAVIAFDLFWLYLSATTAYRALRGYARLLHDRSEDWLVRYRAASVFGRSHLDWDDVRHIVIIPNYKEPLPTLRRTLDSLAAQDVASQIYVVLAMEGREHGAEAKAESLLDAFDGRLGDLTYTVHPAGLAGEIVGKSSNEAWAARIAKRLYVDEHGHSIDDITISSCDADTVFHERYFSCLTYKFATHTERYRRFWQSPVLLNNNIWEIPAPLRVGSALSGVNILSNLVKRNRMIFPQSTYSLSLRMADEVGYWDTDVIPEDWHMFLKCFFAFGGGIEVEPIYLPTGNDGVKAGSYGRSLKMAYIQHKRHAWGACDIPYTIKQCFAHSEIPFRRKSRRLVALASNHLIWSTHWFILTLGWLVPLALADVLGVKLMPMWLPTLARVVLSLCAAPYVVMIFIDARLRPPRPATWRFRDSVTAFVYWWLLPVTSLVFSTAPALESQTRLMLGKRLEYRVTEKS
ncbi:MAG TPA: hypothetical protein VK821_04685, partial [Dehalococcoidia bacterium]|nr:hypothetical protein [Dehalococcoidia bacterium]